MSPRLAFLNASYAVGRLALGAGELSVEAIEDSEPRAPGLPSLATLECAIRSAPHAVSGDLTASMAIGSTRRGRAVLSEALALFDSMPAPSPPPRAASPHAGSPRCARARSP